MVKGKKTNGKNIFPKSIAIIVALIGLVLIGSDLYPLLFKSGALSSNFLLGITLLYESLLIRQGVVPKIRM